MSNNKKTVSLEQLTAIEHRVEWLESSWINSPKLMKRAAATWGYFLAGYAAVLGVVFVLAFFAGLMA